VVSGHPVATTVDAEIARYYLEQHLRGRRTDPAFERRIEQALERMPPGQPARADLQALSRALSVDTATLYLIQALSADPANAAARALFEGELDRVRALLAAGPALATCVAALERPTLLFAPGWFYASNPGTGAAFTAQRRLFDRLGVDGRLIPVVENGTVEANAAIIADEIRRFAAAGEPVILVSASKGGPEVAHALGHLLAPADAAPVQAWVNVGGLLKGAPLADWASSWPQRWLASLYYWYQGLDPGESIASLTTARSTARLARQRIPAHVLVMNFVGVPLSGHISPGAEFGYARTRKAGPNDGLTAIVDELAHGGPAIVQVGLDHYYRDPEIDLKTLALAFTVLIELGNHVPPECAPGARK
jgi:hypothetical protein